MIKRGDRSTDERSPTLHRLKRSIECFWPNENEVYLLHDGLEMHLRIPDPTESDRLVLELLRTGFISEAEIRRRLRERGLSDETLTTSLTELSAVGVIESSRGVTRLTPHQAERYDRQLIYMSDICRPDLTGEDLQSLLCESHVVILGCGGLGSWAACGLVCAGIGTVTLIDDDVVELSNLNRQLLFNESDLGRPKVDAAAAALRAHDTNLTIHTVHERVRSEEQLVDLIDGADFLIGTADWPPYELPRWMNSASLRTGVPYLTAGQFPPLIRVGPTVVPGKSACLECQETATKADYPMYEGLADFRAVNPSTASTIGAASGLIGSIIAMEVIHFLTGAVEPATLGASLLMDLRTMQVEREEVRFHPDCDCRDQSRSSLTLGSTAA